jgi:SSS family solute:Na+ symporter
MRTGTILFLLALPLHLLLGWDITTIILCTGVAVAIYSVLGGIQAVVWTDAIQGIVLISGALICLVFLLFSMPDGIVQTWNIAVKDGKMSLGSFDLTDWTSSTFWVVFAYGIFINLQNYGIDQNYVQRYMAARSEREAKSSAMFGGLLYLPVSFLFFLIGMALYAYYQINISELPADIAVTGMEDRIFPFFIVNKLPVGLTGILIASIFAAGMSTISTSLNSGATIILTDLFRSEKEIRTSRKSMTILYLSTLSITVLGSIIAILMIQVKSVLDAWWNLASIFSGGMLGLFLLGYFSKKATSMNAAIAVTAGILVIVWMSLSPVYFNTEGLICFKSHLHTQLTIVMGTIVIFLTGFLLSKFFISNHENSSA